MNKLVFPDEPLVLAIETSCDDTSAAVVRNNVVLSNIIASQAVHSNWGGIVPELASREHVLLIGHAVNRALSQAGCTMSQVDAIAVTNGPGLPGSLLVGTQFAKGLALRWEKPLLPVHHLEGHIYSGHLETPDLPFPCISLVASGGHTALFLVESWSSYQMIGSTRDDAAGEAFDKIAKMLGMGYPGGPLIEQHSAGGDPHTYNFPRGLIAEQTFDFSFSGLKTAVRRLVQHTPMNDTERSHVCASAQAAIVDVLTRKTLAAALQFKVQTVVVAGGVSANSALRTSMLEGASQHNLRFAVPRGEYCIDNAAMIGFVAVQKLRNGLPELEDFTIQPRALRSKTSYTRQQIKTLN